MSDLSCQMPAKGGVCRKIQIRFDGPPSHESGRFVEVEDASGTSIRLGEWVQDGPHWLLVFDDPHAQAEELERLRKAPSANYWAQEVEREKGKTAKAEARAAEMEALLREAFDGSCAPSDKWIWRTEAVLSGAAPQEPQWRPLESSLPGGRVQVTVSDSGNISVPLDQAAQSAGFQRSLEDVRKLRSGATPQADRVRELEAVVGKWVELLDDYAKGTYGDTPGNNDYWQPRFAELGAISRAAMLGESPILADNARLRERVEAMGPVVEAAIRRAFAQSALNDMDARIEAMDRKLTDDEIDELNRLRRLQHETGDALIAACVKYESTNPGGTHATLTNAEDAD